MRDGAIGYTSACLQSPTIVWSMFLLDLKFSPPTAFDKVMPSPLSFFSFALKVSIKAKESNGSFPSIRIKTNNPAISHLFTDDCYIFTKARLREVDAINETLNDFSPASKKIINHKKYDIFFSCNTHRQFCRMIQRSLHITHSLILGNYLGLPSSIEKIRVITRGFVVAR